MSPDRLEAAVAPRYLLRGELGQGGMATVYRALDTRHDRPVAIKVLRPELVPTVGPERSLREIRLAAQLNHPNIVAVHDSGEADGLPFFVMAIVEGESLRRRLERDRQLPLETALAITRQLASALEHAHRRGVIHRDVKPENILLSGDHAWIADFGIARAIVAATDGRLTETGMSLCTPAYMSPEQASGETELDGRSDLYALGCVLYEMLAGSPPFTGVTAAAILARQVVDPVPPLATVRAGLDTVPTRTIAATWSRSVNMWVKGG